jgi:hypothetical protein
MKKIYLFMSILGYLSANLLVLLESFENKNILLWTKPDETIAGLFANRISTIFAIDLLFVVLVFFVWSFIEAKRLGIKKIWLYWLLTLLFGLAGTLPLFLWAREKHLSLKK